LEEEQNFQSQQRFTVYECNVPALNLFSLIKSAGLFRYGMMGGLLGIDWPQVRTYPLIKFRQVDDDTWRRVTAIEAAYCNTVNDKD